MSVTAFTVRLDKDVYDAVRVLAWVTDRSLNEVVAAAVTAYVLAQPTTAVVEQAQQAYERFQAALDPTARRVAPTTEKPRWSVLRGFFAFDK